MKIDHLLLAIFAFIISLPLVFIISCSGPQYLTKDTQTNLRRSQFMNNIDTGLPNKKGSLLISSNYQYAIEKPSVQTFIDTSFGDEITYIFTTNSYEARHSMGFNLCFAYADYIAAGLLYEMSFGEPIGRSFPSTSNVHNNLYEGSVYGRFLFPIRDLSIGFRLELNLITINGETIVMNDTILSEKNSFHNLRFTIRNTLVSRYNIQSKYGIFAGLQHRVQPYAVANKIFSLENMFGIYTGFGYGFNVPLHLDAYLCIPLGSDVTHFRGPVQLGINLTGILGSNKKKSNN